MFQGNNIYTAVKRFMADLPSGLKGIEFEDLHAHIDPNEMMHRCIAEHGGLSGLILKEFKDSSNWDNFEKYVIPLMDQATEIYNFWIAEDITGRRVFHKYWGWGKVENYYPKNRTAFVSFEASRTEWIQNGSKRSFKKPFKCEVLRSNLHAIEDFPRDKQTAKELETMQIKYYYEND